MNKKLICRSESELKVVPLVTTDMVVRGKDSRGFETDEDEFLFPNPGSSLDPVLEINQRVKLTQKRKGVKNFVSR